MKRHPALHTLSREHHRALVEAHKLQNTAEREARIAAEAFLEYWKEHGASHFLEEELVLIPLWGSVQKLSQKPLASLFLEQHASIRTSIAELEEQLAEAHFKTTLLHRLGRELHEHIRFEERQLFPHLEKIFNDEQWELLRRRSSKVSSIE